ncbi:MAG: hypothetical protein NTZ67_04840 [Gammaproteobacteria bacterium]|nr:hypothetical protein [Gammaproteobacteria bacterium]
MMTLKKAQGGFLIIAAIVLIVIFAVIGVVATYLLNSDILSATNQLAGAQALGISEAGLEGGAHQLLIPTIASRTACTGITGNANLTNFTFTGAAGPVTVTGTGPQSPTASTLSAAITAAATTIPMTSVVTYATSGRIMIDSELIDYSTISGTSFINVRRGVDSTTAVAHASGAPVGQYQCTLQSLGGVPSLSPAGSVIGGGKTTQEAVQLTEAWAVGASTGVIHWNKPTEKAWTAATTSISGTINDVFVLSYANAWMVANRLNSTTYAIARWNGNAWATTAGPAGTAQNLFGIFCTASNNCEAVGASKTALGWNGTTWSTQTVTALPNAQLNGVYCVSASNCWAVGNTSGGADTIGQWTGAAWSLSTATGTAANLNSVWCTSAANCWAVGAARTFVLYNGTSWATQAVAALPNVAYNSVTCVNSSDCWAVGASSGGSVTVHWNGTAWARSVIPSTSTNLNSVSCSNTNNCWAVGVSGTTLYWNGNVWTSIANPSGSTALNSVSIIGPDTQPTSAWQEIFP